MNEVLSVSSPNARKKTGKVRTQLALNSFTDSMVMNLSKLQEIVKDREALSATIHTIAKLDTT